MTPSSANAATAPVGYFEQLQSQGMSPGWAKKKPQMWPAPQVRYVPTVWRAAAARTALDQACDFVSPEFAERRNLIMVNPVPDNLYPSCQNLVAAYQLVLPGETARSHRHSPNALRLVLEAGEQTFTIVNGIKVDVAAGDVVLTPTWHWHGHSNFGDKPAFWIDFLDVPLVQNLENMFFQDHPDRNEAPVGHEPDSSLRFKGVDLAEQLRDQAQVTFAEGRLKTIGLHALSMSPGQLREHPRRIYNSLYTVTGGRVAAWVEGLGQVELDYGDVIAIPAWHSHTLEGLTPGAQMIRVTDEPVYQALGFVDVTCL